MSTDEIKRSSETAMMFVDDPSVEFSDRSNFVKNLGWLLSQTREGVVGCELIKTKFGEVTRINYRNSVSKEVNTNHDSYMAIVKEVVRSV